MLFNFIAEATIILCHLYVVELTEDQSFLENETSNRVTYVTKFRNEEKVESTTRLTTAA